MVPGKTTDTNRGYPTGDSAISNFPALCDFNLTKFYFVPSGVDGLSIKTLLQSMKRSYSKSPLKILKGDIVDLCQTKNVIKRHRQ